MVQNSFCRLFLLPSITYANKAQVLLKNGGIPSRIVRTPKSYQNMGCSYSLKIVRSMEEAKAILKKENIPILGIYPCEGR